MDILLLDDSPYDRLVFRRMIERSFEYHEEPVNLREASSIEEARHLFDEAVPDVVLLDYFLPGEDGLEALEKMQEWAPKRTVFLFLTGMGDERLAVKTLKKGASDYLVKDEVSEKSLYQSIQTANTKRALEIERWKRRRQLKKQRKLLRQKNGELRRAIREIQREDRRRKAELREAHELQDAMLPDEVPISSEYDIATYMETSTEVGGDYYDFRDAEEGKRLISVIGDATGHGFKAGIMVATTKSYFQSLPMDKGPKRVMERISRGIRSMGVRHMYMGLTLIETKGRDFSVLSAGMPPLFVYRSSENAVEQIRLPGMYLGTSLKMISQSWNHHLAPGDILLFLTDGLPELFNARLEMLDYDRIERKLFELRGESAEGVIKGLVELGKDWTNGEKARDDITLLVFRGK